MAHVKITYLHFFKLVFAIHVCIPKGFACFDFYINKILLTVCFHVLHILLNLVVGSLL